MAQAPTPSSCTTNTANTLARDRNRAFGLGCGVVALSDPLPANQKQASHPYFANPFLSRQSYDTAHTPRLSLMRLPCNRTKQTNSPYPGVTASVPNVVRRLRSLACSGVTSHLRWCDGRPQFQHGTRPRGAWECYRLTALHLRQQRSAVMGPQHKETCRISQHGVRAHNMALSVRLARYHSP